MEIVLDQLGRPPTENKVSRMRSSYQKAKIVRTWRQAACALWSQYSETVVSPPVVVVATPLHQNRRSPQDPGACLPAVKAVVDGAVDAGLLEDDDYRYVRAVILNAPDFCGVDGLRVRLR